MTDFGRFWETRSVDVRFMDADSRPVRFAPSHPKPKTQEAQCYKVFPPEPTSFAGGGQKGRGPSKSKNVSFIIQYVVPPHAPDFLRKVRLSLIYKTSLREKEKRTK